MAESSRATYTQMRTRLESMLLFRAAAGVLSFGDWITSLAEMEPGEYGDRPASDPQPDVIGALQCRRARIEILRGRATRGERLDHPADGWRDQAAVQERLGILVFTAAPDGRGNGASHGEEVARG